MDSDNSKKFQHPDYLAFLPIWTKLDDVCEGNETVKAAGQTYLPKVSPDQTDDEYKAYLLRSTFFNATGRTVDGLTGAMFRKPPTIKVPNQLDDLMKDTDGDGTPIQIVAVRTAESILKLGRFGLFADMPEETGAKPVVNIIGYHPNHIWDWRVENKKLVYLVLYECKDTPGDDGMGHVEKEQLLILRLTNNIYTAERWEKQKVKDQERKEFVRIEEPRIITVRGKALDYIPFFCLGPKDIAWPVQKSPITDLVDINLSHYCTSADFEHGSHHTALPTPVVIGVREGSTNNYPIGPTRAWKLPAGADAKMLEFTGKGLETLVDSLDRKERQMVILGARLLEDQKKSVESSDTHRIRHSGENSILASIADVAGRALTKIVEIARDWLGAKGDVKIEINKDFFDQPMEPGRIDSLVKAWMSGTMSKQTVVWNWKRGELLPDDVDIEDELDRIAEDQTTLNMGEDTEEDDGTGTPPGQPPKKPAKKPAKDDTTQDE